MRKFDILSFSHRQTFFATLLSMLSPLLASFVDGFIVSNKLGPECFGTMSLYNPLHNVLSIIVTFCGCGASILASKAVATQNYKKCKKIFSSSILTAFFVGIALFVLIAAFSYRLSFFLTGDAVSARLLLPFVKGLSFYYFFYTLSNTISFFALALGASVLASRVMLLSQLANVLLDILFICVLDWGMEGASYATSLSAVLSLLLYIPYIYRNNMLRVVAVTTHTFRQIGRNIYEALAMNMGGLLLNFIPFWVSLLVVEHIGQKAFFAWGVCQYIYILLLNISFSIYDATFFSVVPLRREGDFSGARYLIIKSIKWLFALSLASLIAVYFFHRHLAIFFGGNPDADYFLQPLLLWSAFSSVIALTCIYLLILHVAEKQGVKIILNIIDFIFVLLIPVTLIFIMEDGEWLWYGMLGCGMAIDVVGFSACYYFHVKDKTLTSFTLISKLPNLVMLDLSVDVNPDNISEVQKQIHQFTEILEMTKERAMQLEICCEEMMYNIISRAGKRSKTFDLRISDHKVCVHVTIKDAGKPYSPILPSTKGGIEYDADGMPDTTNLERVLVNKLCDNLDYRYAYGLNITQMDFKKV